jgi:hypothetical protein
MDTSVVDYLRNPMQTGVWNARAILDFGEVKVHLQQWLEKFETEVKSGKERSALRRELNSQRLLRLREALGQFLGELEDAKYFDALEHALMEFAVMDDAPEATRRIFARQHTIPYRAGRLERIRWIRRFRRPEVLESRVLTDKADVVSVERERLSNDSWLFNVTSLRRDGVNSFKDDLGAIPMLVDKMRMLREKKVHSARYVYRPYTLATGPV